MIFVVGGTTYEESRAVALLNASNSGVRFIVGGSVILNSKRYLLVFIDWCNDMGLYTSASFFPLVINDYLCLCSEEKIYAFF